MRLRPFDHLLYLGLQILALRDRLLGLRQAFSPENVRAILAISSTALGDTVMSTGALQALRRRYPDRKIVLLVHQACVDLMESTGMADRVLPYYGGYRKFWRTAAAIRREGCDTAVILHGNEPQATPLAYLGGARWIFKLPNTNRFRFLLANREPVLGWSDFTHGVEQRYAVAALAGADLPKALRIFLPVREVERQAVEGFLAASGVEEGATLVGLQCCASSGSRMWPAESFIQLGRTLLARGSVWIILTGAPNEYSYLEKIRVALGPRAINTAGKFPLRILPALVARLKVLVSGDTGTLHVAVAVGTPVVGIYAVSSPAASGPFQDFERHVVIHRPDPEFHVRTKSNDNRCIARIPVDDVLKAVDGRLALQGGAGQ